MTRTDKNGDIEVLAERWEGKRLNAPNDIVVSRNDHVYFTDPAFGEQADHRELDFYGVYHIPPKGPMKLVAKPAGRPNGIALSPNGRILYVLNSDERNVRAYDLDTNGDASDERVLISGHRRRCRAASAWTRRATCISRPRASSIYSPDGKLLHTMEMQSRASNCGFGGRRLQDALHHRRAGACYRARMDVRGAY